MKPLILNPKMNKERGDVAESMFQTAALVHGLVPHFPFGDWLPHDIVLFNPQTFKFFRVQIKSTEACRKGRNGLHFSTSKGSKNKTGYTESEADVMALYCFTSEEWFLVPMAEIKGRKTISLGPKNELRQYLNNWTIFL